VQLGYQVRSAIWLLSYIKSVILRFKSSPLHWSAYETEYCVYGFDQFLYQICIYYLFSLRMTNNLEGSSSQLSTDSALKCVWNRVLCLWIWSVLYQICIYYLFSLRMTNNLEGSSSQLSTDSALNNVSRSRIVFDRILLRQEN
jgi:hypothetical protein